MRKTQLWDSVAKQVMQLPHIKSPEVKHRQISLMLATLVAAMKAA